MSRRVANTPTWRLVEAVARGIYGRSWRRGIDEIFVLPRERGRQRRTFDRPRRDEQRREIERRLLQAIAVRELELRAEIEQLEPLRRIVALARSEREFVRDRTPQESWEDLLGDTAVGDMLRRDLPAIFTKEDA